MDLLAVVWCFNFNFCCTSLQAKGHGDPLGCRSCLFRNQIITSVNTLGQQYQWDNPMGSVLFFHFPQPLHMCTLIFFPAKQNCCPDSQNSAHCVCRKWAYGRHSFGGMPIWGAWAFKHLPLQKLCKLVEVLELIYKCSSPCCPSEKWSAVDHFSEPFDRRWGGNISLPNNATPPCHSRCIANRLA